MDPSRSEGMQRRSAVGGDVDPAAGRGRAGHRRRARKASLPRRIAVWTAASLAFVVLLASGVAWFLYNDLVNGLQTSNALDGAAAEAPAHTDKSVNLLLIGLDSRKDADGNDLPKQFVQDELHAGSSDIGGYNTNTLILMHIPPKGGQVTAFSIPRDDYVSMPAVDGKQHKIKEAYDRAKYAAENKLAAQGVKDPTTLEQQGREAGREATIRTVQQFLGVPVDHFAEVNLLGFYDVAKALGSVTVCLKAPVKDRYSGADFQAGLQDLNPMQALAFVRQRHGLTNGDLDRTHRQQAFLSSVAHKLDSDGVLSDLPKLTSLIDVLKKDVVIDNRWDVLDFAAQAKNLTGGKVVFYTLPIEGYATRDQQDVNLVDPVKIRGIVAEAFGQKVASPSPTASASPSPSVSPSPSGHRSAAVKGAASTTPSPSLSVSGAPPLPETPPTSGAQGGPVKMDGIPCVN